jgi:tetratricopeptide (TPR) repeat protein
MVAKEFMNLRTLSDLIPTLIIEGKFGDAETKLLEARRDALAVNDVKALGEHILPLLVNVYSSQEPPNLTKAEAYSRELEQVDPRAYTKLQTAMLLYHVAGDYPHAIAKLEQAVSQGKAENDESTVYSSLSVLGQALLQLDRKSEAVRVLKEIEQMVLTRKSFVVGDETLFLESARARGLELPTVKKLASVLAPLCRDPEFANRLRALAQNAA